MIKLYTREGCVKCLQVKALLNSKQIMYLEQKIGVDVTRDEVLNTFPGRSILPIIVKNGAVIEDFETLRFLIETDQLDLL